MKVAELREVIAEMPGEWEVVLQKDAEGNGYSPAVGAEPGLHVGDGWEIEVWDEEDEDVPEGAEPCLVLWPVN